MNNLPSKYIITHDAEFDKDVFLKKLSMHISQGARLIQLRAKNLSQEEYIDLAKDVITLSRASSCKVILNATLETVLLLDADGIHLTSKDLLASKKRPLPKNKLVSAACHSQHELQHAQNIGVDFVTLSPVLQTNTHPEASPLGFENFAELCSLVDIPVFALGGMHPAYLKKVQACGGHGIAGIQSLWDKLEDPE